MHSAFILALALLGGCTGGTGTTPEEDIDWCDPPTYERWSLTQRSAGAPTPVTSVFNTQDGEPGTVVLEPGSYVDQINQWWTPKEYNPTSPLDTGTYYGDDCCYTIESDGCPCGTHLTTDATMSITSLLVNNANTGASLDAAAPGKARPPVCVNDDGTMAVFSFDVAGDQFGTLTVAGDGEGTFNAGEAGTFLHLELFGANPPVTFDNTEWSQGQLSITSTGTNFGVSLTSVTGVKQAGLRVEIRATMTATP